ncbi:MAG: hypothetical protein J7L47_02735, partial [Candidatus Odinarchaeota archaeon]|nr:hypothetical protein [Candidatus Odinarchaeota archaeon]
ERVKRIEAHTETSSIVDPAETSKVINKPEEDISTARTPSPELDDYYVDNMTIYFYDFDGTPLNNTEIDVFTTTDSTIYAGNLYSKNYVTISSIHMDTSAIYILIRRNSKHPFIFYFTPVYTIGNDTSLNVYLNETLYTQYYITLPDYMSGKLSIEAESIYLGGSYHYVYSRYTYQLESSYTTYLYLNQNTSYLLYLMLEKPSEIYLISNDVHTGVSSTGVHIDDSYINNLSSTWTIVNLQGRQNGGSSANISIKVLSSIFLVSDIHDSDTVFYISPTTELASRTIDLIVYTYVEYPSKNETWRYEFHDIPSIFISETNNNTYTFEIGTWLSLNGLHWFGTYGMDIWFSFSIVDSSNHRLYRISVYNSSSNEFLRYEVFNFSLTDTDTGAVLYNGTSSEPYAFLIDSTKLFNGVTSANLRLSVSFWLSPSDTFSKSDDFTLTRVWINLSPDLKLTVGLNSDYSWEAPTTAYLVNGTSKNKINKIHFYLTWYYSNVIENGTTYIHNIEEHSMTLPLYPISDSLCTLTRTFSDNKTVILNYNVEDVIKFQMIIKVISDNVLEIKVLEEAVSSNVLSYSLKYIQETFNQVNQFSAIVLSESKYSKINDYFRIDFSGGMRYTYVSRLSDFYNITAPSVGYSDPLDITLFTHNDPSITSLSMYDYLIIVENTNETHTSPADYYYAVTKLTKVQQLRYNINSLISSIDSLSAVFEENETATLIDILQDMLDQISNATQMYASGRYSNASLEFNTVTIKYITFMNLLGDIFHQSFLNMYYTHPESRDITPVAIFFGETSCFYTQGQRSAINFLLTLTYYFLEYNIPFEVLNSTELETYITKYPRGYILIPDVPLTYNLISDAYNNVYSSSSLLASWIRNGGNLILIGLEPLRGYFDASNNYHHAPDMNNVVSYLTNGSLTTIHSGSSYTLVAQHTDEYEFSNHTLTLGYSIALSSLPQAPTPPFYLYSNGQYVDFVVFAGPCENSTITFAFMDEITTSYYKPISSLIAQLLKKYDALATGVSHYKHLRKNKNASRLADLSTFYDTFILALSSVEYGRTLLMNNTSFDSIDYFLDGISKASLYLDLKGSLFDMLKKNVEELKEEVLKAISQYNLPINETEIFELIEQISMILENQTNLNETAVYDLILNLTSNIDKITNSLNSSINRQYLSKINTFNLTITSLISHLPALLNNSEEFINNLNSIVNETLQNLIKRLNNWDFMTALSMGQFLDIALCNATIFIYNEVGDKLVNATKLLNSIAYLIYSYLSPSAFDFIFNRLGDKLTNITLMISKLNETRNYDEIIGNLSELILQFAQTINSSVGSLIDDFSAVLYKLNQLSLATYSVAQENMTMNELEALHNLLLQAINLTAEGHFDLGLSIISNNSKNIEVAISSIIKINYEKLDTFRKTILKGTYDENANLTSLLVKINDIRLTLQTAEVALEKQQYKLALSSLKDAESKLNSLILSSSYTTNPPVIASQESLLMQPFVIIGVQYFPYFLIALLLFTLIGSVIALRRHALTKVAVEELQPPIQPPTFKSKAKAIRKVCPNYREYNGIHICTSTFPPSIISERIANKICKSSLHWPACKPILSNLPLTEKFDPENICMYLRVYKEGAFFKFSCKAKNIELNKDFAKLVCINNPTWEHCPYYKEVAAPALVAKPSLIKEEICPYAEYNAKKKKYVCKVSSTTLSDEEFRTLCSKNYEMCLLYKQGLTETREPQKEEKTVEAIVEDAILKSPNRCEYLTKEARGFVCMLSNRVVTEFEVNTLCSKEFHTMCRIYQTEAKKKDKFGDVLP